MPCKGSVAIGNSVRRAIQPKSVYKTQTLPLYEKAVRPVESRCGIGGQEQRPEGRIAKPRSMDGRNVTPASAASLD
jgi:hypothetical protein